MKVSYVIDDLRTGGAQTHLVRLLRELLERGGIDAEVVSMGPIVPGVAAQLPAAVPVVPFRLASIRDPGFLFSFIALVRHLRRRRPEIVHTYLNTAGVFGLLAARLAGVPHSVTSRRDIGIFRSGRIRSLEATLSRRWADRVFCVCEAVAAAVRRDEAIPSAKLRVLLNGIDVRGIEPRRRDESAAPLRFCIVAAMNRVEKGHREFLEAAALAAREVGAEFVLVGDGPLRPALEAQAARLGLRAVFAGNQADVLGSLDSVDVVVVPSYTEGISNAVLEAMAKGLPVIATAVDGNLESVADGETGKLVASKDPQALAAAMLAYARDPRLAARHGAAGRRRLDRLFTAQAMADRYEAEYRELLLHRPRIALVESSSGVGGTAKCVHQMVESLDRGKYEPVVFARARVGWHAEIERRGRATLVLTGTRPFKASGYLGKLAELAGMLPQAWRYRRLFRSHGIRLVHTNNNVLDQIPALLAARSLALPVVCHIHDQVPLTTVEKKAARLVDRFFVLSRAARDLYARDLPGSKLSIVHNGLLLEEYAGVSRDGAGPELRHPAVGLVGRLVEWKGQETLVRAAPRVLAAVPNATFYVVGDDPGGGAAFKDRLLRLARELGCEASFVFTGWIADPRPWLARFDVNVCPSLAPEPFGLVVLESMALGAPVVASRHGGPLDVIEDGVDGLFHTPGDSDDLARAILELLRDPAKSARIAEAAREKVRRSFAMPAVMPAIEKAYAELLRPRESLDPGDSTA